MPRFRRSNPACKLAGAAASIFSKLSAKYQSLTPQQVELLALFSGLRARHANALAKLTQEGEVVSQQLNPWLKIAETCESKMFNYFQAFLATQPRLRHDVDPFDELVSEAKR
jgi:hypothetical protein